MPELAEIEEFVVRFEGRGPGTDAERRASRYLTERLEGLGREVETEAVWVWPNYQLAHLASALLAILGSVVAVANAGVGLGLAAAALVSAYGDLSGRLYLLRRLTGRRASQTVVSREDGSKPGTLILLAHYDAARGRAAFGRVSERRAAIAKLLRVPIGPFDAYSGSLLVLVVALALRAAGLTGTAVSIVQFIPTVVLIVSVPWLVDMAIQGIVPGASDNASGVATVLRLAERYGETLDHFDVWVLFPGAGEAMMLGMRAWLARHKRELDPTRTVFLNVAEVGHGTVRYVTREGYLLTRRFHSQLLALCSQIATEDADENRYGARPLSTREATDAYPAAVAGFPALSITCRGALDYVPTHHRHTDTPDRLDEGALDRAFRFCSELVELIDEKIGPQLSPRGTAPARRPRAERIRRAFSRLRI
jgi:Peptidase family M28